MNHVLSRRAFIKNSSAAAVASALAAFGEATNTTGLRPKNVLFLMTDEHNIRHLSANGHTQALTPHLDRLMRGGVYFENALCSYPVCTPSRGTLHTGMWPHTHGQDLNVNDAKHTGPTIPGGIRGGLKADTHLLATSFHEQGFACYHEGKWHLGDVRRHACYNWNSRARSDDLSYRPMLREWLKAHHPAADLPPGRWHEIGGWPIYALPGMEKFKATGLPYVAGRTSLPLNMDYSAYYTDRALADLQECGPRPFMLTWSDPGPHGPHVVPEPYYSAVDPAALPMPTNLFRPAECTSDPSCQSYDKLLEFMGAAGLREYQRCYCGLVRKIDDQIGRLLAELERRGDLDDTLIVFTADHGDMCCSHRTAGGKAIWEHYDEIVRVPLIFHWPRGIKGGRRLRTHAEGVDVMPTILDYMGLAIPVQCQGRSLRNYMEGHEDLERPAFCEASHPEANLVRRMIRSHEWALWFYCQGTPGKPFAERRPMALYDLVADPGEEHNLAAEAHYADVRKKLIGRIMGHMEESRDPWLKHMPFLRG